MKEIGIEEEKLNLIPNAVDLERFNKQKFDVKNKSKILKLITVARYSPKKGFDLLPDLSKKLIDNKNKFSMDYPRKEYVRANAK